MAGNSSLEGHPVCQPKMCYSQTMQELRTDDEENADILMTERNDRCSYLNGNVLSSKLFQLEERHTSYQVCPCTTLFMCTQGPCPSRSETGWLPRTPRAPRRVQLLLSGSGSLSWGIPLQETYYSCTSLSSMASRLL